MEDLVSLVLIGLLLYSVPLLILCVPIFLLGRKKLQWTLYDLCILFFPFIVWICVSLIWRQGKHLCNYLGGEEVLLALPMPFILGLRVLLSKIIPRPFAILLCTIIGMLIGILLWRYVPAIGPE